MAFDWQSLTGMHRLRASARHWLDEGSIAAADRLELARLEWRRHRSALAMLLIAAIVLLLFFFGAFFIVSMVVLLHYWQTPHWTLAWAGVLSLWLLVILAAAWVLWRTWRRMGQPFALTRRVLAEDWQALREHV